MGAHQVREHEQKNPQPFGNSINVGQTVDDDEHQNERPDNWTVPA